MKTSMMIAMMAAVTAAGCTASGSGGQTSPDILKEAPEGVVAIAAPFQDLSVLRINPNDGCYEYLHTGPVETTFLPLRTAAGNPICSRAPEA